MRNGSIKLLKSGQYCFATDIAIRNRRVWIVWSSFLGGFRLCLEVGMVGLGIWTGCGRCWQIWFIQSMSTSWIVSEQYLFLCDNPPSKHPCAHTQTPLGIPEETTIDSFFHKRANRESPNCWLIGSPIWCFINFLLLLLGFRSQLLFVRYLRNLQLAVNVCRTCTDCKFFSHKFQRCAKNAVVFW